MNMDLLCAEIADCQFAERDPALFQDMRVLQNLLDLEPVYTPRCNYFTMVQKDIKPFMRKVVSTWMLEVCEEQLCEDQVFPLAVNFLDRFLCCCPISRCQLQLVAAVCLLIASKIRQYRALSVDHLCYYTDHSVTPDQMRAWEVLVLSKLKWDVSGVTAFDYIDHVLERVSWSKEHPFIRRHALTLVGVCYTEPDLVQCPPSLLASASIGAAVRGLNVPSSGIALESVCTLTRANAEAAEQIIAKIEHIITTEAQAMQQDLHVQQHLHPGKHAKSMSSVSGQPETPTDIQDVHF